jgi:queuosine precursor transporter
MNFSILCFHVSAICMLTLLALRFGKETMIAWLSILTVAMNLFVIKQITLFGLNVTASDALGVGYLLGLNLIQEFFGQKEARKCVLVSMFIALAFLVLSTVHLSYAPNVFDLSQNHFAFILKPMPRLFAASLFTFFAVQSIDLVFFSFLRRKTGGKYLTLRTITALLLSQTIDTVLFSYLGLYGLVVSVFHVVCLSLAVKIFVILFSMPYIGFSKKIAPYEI